MYYQASVNLEILGLIRTVKSYDFIPGLLKIVLGSEIS